MVKSANHLCTACLTNTAFKTNWTVTRSVAVGIMMFLQGCAPAEPKVAYGTIEQERVQLLAPQAEQIRQLLVQKGQSVQVGQVLLRLDDRAAVLKVNKAQADVARAQAQLTELQEGNRAQTIAAGKARLAQTEANLVDARKQLKRAEELSQAKLLAQVALDSARLNVQIAQNQRDAAKEQQQELELGARSTQIAQAEFALQSAKQQLALEQKYLSDLDISAPVDAMVEDLPYLAGERVPVGAVLALLSQQQSSYARLYIPADLLSQFQLGKQVRLTRDGGADLTGAIRFIAQQPSFTPYYALHQQERAHLMYLVEVALALDVNVPAGLPVQLPLETAHD